MRYRSCYQMLWEMEVTDLEGGDGSGGGGVVEEAEAESDTEDRGGERCKWRPRQDIDTDGSN